MSARFPIPAKLGNVTAREICSALQRPRIRLDHEESAQRDLHTYLCAQFPGVAAGIVRELRLTAAERVDLWFNGTVIEVKLRCRGHQKLAVYKQLCRYAKHPAVDNIILAHNLDMTLPDRVEDKPAYAVSLGMAWLR